MNADERGWARRSFLICVYLRSSAATISAMSLTNHLCSAGIVLPPVSGPFGAYVPAKRVGNLIYVAGQLPMKDGKLMAVGQVPSRRSVEEATAAARQCAINALAAVQVIDGGIDILTGVARVGVFVSSDSGFTQQPQVANGASELLLELFGESGRHVRAAVGVNTLPLDASVEVELIFEANPQPH
jgi:enamine deaminase RidA (YjgF/YER057c/UK114 family)